MADRPILVEKRKVQSRQYEGKTYYTLSLPKDWVEENDLGKKWVLVKICERSLEISPFEQWPSKTE